MKHLFYYILIGCSSLFCTATAFSQHHLGYLANTPLLLKTGPYRVDNISDSMVHLLSGRLTVQTMPWTNTPIVDAWLGNQKGLAAHAAKELSYRLRGHSQWKPFPAKENAVLLDTLPNVGDTIVVQFGLNGNLLNQLWFIMPFDGPQLYRFRLKSQQDTADQGLLASPKLGSQPLPPIFDTLLGSRLIVPSGKLPQLLCNLIANKDSCLEYRLVDTCNIQGPWRTATSLFVPMGLEPGNQYQLQLRFAGSRHYRTYYLEMLPYWYDTPTAICLFGGMAVSIVFTGIMLNNRRRLQQSTDADQRLKLASMQWQPHFVANAVSGIMQSLSEGTVQHARNCLSEMVDFFRNTLKGSSKAMVPLQQELDQALSYLQLVQWHLGFSYRITVAADVDTQEVFFPSLLLQPILENAVHHGVKCMGSNGHISIEAGWDNDDLLVCITDNGSAALSNPTYKGMGKQLTEQRVRQLNRLMGQQYPVSHRIDHSAAGTKALFEISNWRNKT